VRVSGCTVHFVDEGTDTGPIVAQAAVPVLPDDDAERLRLRILAMEHQLYPAVLRAAVEGRLHVVGGKVRVEGALELAMGLG
jgi:phosphoribosylglycinamide formyltransferase 1